jgi:trans-aconitate methyltransferase
MTEAREGPKPKFDTSVAHVARVYNYWLGGKDNFAADRKAGDEALKTYPQIASSVLSNRAFLARAVRLLVQTMRIRQFLDIGTGIPAADNTHEVAQRLAPESRIVYADNDPIVLSHARALLTSTRKGACDYIDADLRDTDAILDQAARTLDFSKPVAIMLIAILHCIPDADDPFRIVTQLLDAVPPGSFLAISHPASDLGGRGHSEMHRRVNPLMSAQVTLRTGTAVTQFFDGLWMLKPGIVVASQWRPTTELEANAPAAAWVGVGHKR